MLKIKQIACGHYHSFVLLSDGSVWATGRNDCGQLGNGTKINSAAWIAVMSGGVSQIAAGAHHSLLLKTDGSVWATGWNVFGQLGDGTTTNKSAWEPIVQAGTEVSQIAAGWVHSLLLKTEGSVWATGWNVFGQLGDGTTTNKSTWKPVTQAGTGVSQSSG